MVSEKKAVAVTMFDLHMHSSHSDDGEIAPETLVALAKAAGLRCIALTDHDVADGNAAFVAAALAAGITAVPGIEIDCEHDGTGLHVLGYFIDYTDARYAALRDDVLEKKRSVAGRRVELIRALGIALDDGDLARHSQFGIATGEAIAEAALENPANGGNALLAPFRAGGARSDNPLVNFYWDLCAPGKPGYVHIRYMSLAEAVKLIKDTGGVAVLAHPGQSLRGAEGLVDGIAAAGVRGVEAYSSYHTPEQCAYWAKEAGRLGMFVTCGSDFHGKIKPAIRMGGHGAAL